MKEANRQPLGYIGGMEGAPQVMVVSCSITCVAADSVSHFPDLNGFSRRWIPVAHVPSASGFRRDRSSSAPFSSGLPGGENNGGARLVRMLCGLDVLTGATCRE